MLLYRQRITITIRKQWIWPRLNQFKSLLNQLLFVEWLLLCLLSFCWYYQSHLIPTTQLPHQKAKCFILYQGEYWKEYSIELNSTSCSHHQQQRVHQMMNVQSVWIYIHHTINCAFFRVVIVSFTLGLNNRVSLFLHW